MSRQGVEAVRLGVEDVRRVIATLTEEEWALPSGCQGWRVQDLVAHLGSNFKETVDPTPPAGKAQPMTAEQAMEALVEPRRSWSTDQVRDEYLGYCDRAVDVLTAMQDEPLASTVIPLADLGHYQMHQLADAYAFDHYCHVRADLLAPRGPIRRTVEPSDETRLAPTVGWMLAGVPQMQPDLHATVAPDRPLRLTLTGPGGGSWTISRPGKTLVVNEASEDDGAAAAIESDGHAFVLWGTDRQPWRDHCSITGDDVAASRFLDALNIV